MKYKLIKRDDTWFWQNKLDELDISVVDSIDIVNVYKVIKKILFDIAWDDIEQRNFYISFLQEHTNIHGIARDAYVAVNHGRDELKKFFLTLEIDKGSSISYKEDYSDDSDDNEYISALFHGASLAHQNHIIISLREKFLQSLSIILDDRVPSPLIRNEAETFREAMQPSYIDHLNKSDIKQDIEIIEITRKSDSYKIKYKNDSGQLKKIDTPLTPYISLFRGIGYFSDRWDADSRAIHREELLRHNLYSESIIRRHSGPWYRYIGQDLLDYYELKKDSKMLTDHLIKLRNTDPLIVKLGTKYRIFANLVEFMQFVYTNGIENFLPL